MAKIIEIGDVIPVTPGKTGMIVSQESLKGRKHCDSIEIAQKILGEGVSLEIIRIWETDRYTPIKVYLSKRGTCCLLAKAYPKYQI